VKSRVRLSGDIIFRLRLHHAPVASHRGNCPEGIHIFAILAGVENVAHVDHPVYAKTPDNVNQCPVCKNRLKFLVYQANTGHQLFDYYRKTYRAQANATKVARAYLVAAKSSAVFPYFMQNSEAEYPENAISHILPPISKPQTTEH